MITIKDVAKHSGYDISTVSRALRGKGYVKAETANVIKETADRLGYIADSSAQQLRNGKSKTIGIIVSDINNPFYNRLISHIEQRLKKYGMVILISYSFEDPEEERNSFYSLMAAKVSTIIFTPVTRGNVEMVNRALSAGIKVIQLYRNVYDFLTTMIFDDELGAYIATNHLIERNCKKILLIDVSYNDIEGDLVSPSRAKGYLRALSEHNCDYSLIFKHDLIKKMPNSLSKFILKYRPDGIVAGTNNFAMEALKVIKDINLKIPEDIKFVTFDDLEWVSFLSISAIRQHIKKLADNLVNEIRQTNNAPMVIKVEPELNIRSSSL